MLYFGLEMTNKRYLMNGVCAFVFNFVVGSGLEEVDFCLVVWNDDVWLWCLGSFWEDGH